MTGTIGFLIPEFPQQTHIAWWRVAEALRKNGHRVRVLSTRRAGQVAGFHASLRDELPNVMFAWPPATGVLVSEAARNPKGVARAFGYLLSLKQSSAAEKLRLFPVLLAAVNLAAILRREGIKHVFVHSFGNAAHMLAMCNRMTGVRYGLRLGGDPGVYGKDHAHKAELADFVLSASPTYFDELVDRHGVARGKLFWSWVGTDLSAFAVGADWPDNRHDRTLRVITVARLNAKKGHIETLEAIRDLVAQGVDLRYDIVGEGPDRERIEAFIASSGLERRVSLLGPRGTSEIAEMLRSSDVFVLSSHGAGEAAPAAVCEAMAAGVPCICTRIGVTDLMVADGVDGFLVPQKDSGAIAARLRELADNPWRLAEMKRAAKAASSKFDVRATAQRLVELFGLE